MKRQNIRKLILIISLLLFQVRSLECILCGACIDGCSKKVLSYGMIEREKGNGNRKKD